VLLNDVTTAQRDLDAVTQRLALSNLESLAQQTNLVMLSTATPPLDPSSPKLLILLAGGVFLGGVLGVVVVLLLELRDKRIRDDADLAGLLGVPVLGRIGNVKVDRPKTKSASRKLAPV
jgi:uncharacterized protein involved in exopolysaccharide biosynthesis